MDQKQIDILTQKIADNTISDAELKQYYDWLSSDDQQPLEISSAANREELQNRIFSKIAEKSGFSYVQHKRVKLWPRIGIAAAVATIIVSAGIWLYQAGQKDNASQGALVNDVAPGKQGATLTLASGKKIRLSDAMNGELAEEAGVVITKSADGQLIYEIKGSNSEINKINILSTAKGETYLVRLPDGSMVWLNAASSLTYSAALRDGGKRRVKLDGEGYFEIAKDKLHPFVVEARGQQVEVLGTHFNINSYVDEPAIKTTLLEGSVKVSAQGLTEKILKPNQQSSLTSSSLKVAEVDTEEVIAWKNGYFIFNDEDLETIMRKVSRWYDVEVIYQDETLKSQGFGGRIPRFSKVSELIEMLEMIKLARFKVEGRRIMVSKY